MTDRFEELRTFAVVAEHRSFSRAARELGVALSAVSRRVRELEDRLGVQLLQRTTRQVDLDDAQVRDKLRERVSAGAPASIEPDEFIADPMTSWIESTFGVEQVEGRWERVTPRAIGGPVDDDGAAAELAVEPARGLVDKQRPRRPCGGPV